MRGWLNRGVAGVAVVLAIAAGACEGEEQSEGRDGELAASFIRIGEDLQTAVTAYDAELPPGLLQALNPGMTAEDSPENALALPVHPDGRLVGSLRRDAPTGEMTFFLTYEAPLSDIAVEETLRAQLDESPWQVVGGQSSEAFAVVQFQPTISGDVTGTVVIQPLPAAEQFTVVVERDGVEQVIELARRATVPVFPAAVDERSEGLEIGALLPEARAAGLAPGDLVRAVAGHIVSTPVELQDALRAIRDDEEPRTSVVYIVQVAPPVALGDTAEFVLPATRPVPDDFPAPFLLRDGMTALDVQWASAPGISTYQLTLLTAESPFDVVDAYRTAIDEQDEWVLMADQAIGFGTQLDFTTEDQTVSGSLSADAFPQDETLTMVVLQVQRQRGSN